MRAKTIHKLNQWGYTICRDRKPDQYIHGSVNDHEVTCKICRAGGMRQFRLNQSNMKVVTDFEKFTMYTEHDTVTSDGTTGYLVYPRDKVNSILGAALMCLNKEELIVLRDALTERTK